MHYKNCVHKLFHQSNLYSVSTMFVRRCFYVLVHEQFVSYIQPSFSFYYPAIVWTPFVIHVYCSYRTSYMNRKFGQTEHFSTFFLKMIFLRKRNNIKVEMPWAEGRRIEDKNAWKMNEWDLYASWKLVERVHWKNVGKVNTEKSAAAF